MSETKQNLHLTAAVILFCAAMVFGYLLQLKNDEQKQQPTIEPQNDLGVCVISVDFGRKPLFLWSNRRAEQAEDGTITISTTSKGDF